ncbi:hypothetical protein ERJ75_000471700 [Trypanosoma vivax]|nr:hypothetical protein ERJ75_000471700 [Trypanosoma vivax]
MLFVNACVRGTGLVSSQHGTGLAAQAVGAAVVHALTIYGPEAAAVEGEVAPDVHSDPPVVREARRAWHATCTHSSSSSGHAPAVRTQAAVLARASVVITCQVCPSGRTARQWGARGGVAGGRWQAVGWGSAATRRSSRQVARQATATSTERGVALGVGGRCGKVKRMKGEGGGGWEARPSHVRVTEARTTATPAEEGR